MHATRAIALTSVLALWSCASQGAETGAIPAPGAARDATAPVEKRAFELADVTRNAQVASPALSPDGKWIAFVVRRIDLEQDKSWSELWRIGTDGEGLRRLTQGQQRDSDPVFSPDGRTLYFVSDRSGTSQIHALPVDGGEGRCLTSFPAGVADPLPSPDGRFLAVTSELFADCGIDAECNEARGKALEEGKLAVHVADELLYRHWTSWRDGKVTHVLLVDAASGDVVRDLTPGPFDAPTFSLGGDRGFDFSPDGKELVFVSNHERLQAESTNADLWIVPVEGAAEPRNLTDANDGWDGAPLFSPDGRSIAFISQATPGYESDLRRLAVLERASGKVRYLTERTRFDDWVGDMRWSADGKTLFFQADHRGRTPIFRVPAGGDTVTPVLTDATIDAWELAAGGDRIVYARRSVGAPHELYSAELGGGDPRRLTRFNAALEEEVDLRPAEEMWVEGIGGHDVHVFLVKPHGFDPARRYPLVLNVHGGPQSQWTDAYRGDWQVYPGAGYVVAFANPTGSTGYGQDFCDGIRGDWGGRVFGDLMRVTDALVELPYVDPDKIGAMGWSYGGYMMMWMQGHTDRFKCQAAMMGLYDLRSFYGATEELWFPEHDLFGAPWESEHYERWSPSNSVANFKTPALVIAGELDYRVPYTQSLQYFTALQKKSVPSRLVVYPNAGHWPGWREMFFYYNAHLDWFHRYLGGQKAPYEVMEMAAERGVPKAPAPEDLNQQ